MTPQGAGTAETRHVRCRVDGALGRITLDRPRALNALELEMITTMLDALAAWEDDARVQAVVVDSADERAFCAGGDIAVVHRSAYTDAELARRLWREEYRLDARLARYAKPVVTIMDGLALGGGMGIGCHASTRIVTERAELAMPEVAIGLAPDVAGTLLLARAPGELGMHLALTGLRVGADDALYCGLADHLVPSSRLADLAGALVAGTPVDVAVAKYAHLPGRSALADQRSWLDQCYVDSRDVTELLLRLARRPEPEAAEALRRITAGSPTAAAVTWHAVRRAGAMTGIEECLRQDYRLCSRFLEHPDLAEGIRAAVIDKDRNPSWEPAEFASLTAEDIEGFFAPLADELVL